MNVNREEYTDSDRELIEQAHLYIKHGGTLMDYENLVNERSKASMREKVKAPYLITSYNRYVFFQDSSGEIVFRYLPGQFTMGR